jgi:hypothetical protein
MLDAPTKVIRSNISSLPCLFYWNCNKATQIPPVLLAVPHNKSGVNEGNFICLIVWKLETKQAEE